MTVHRVVYIVSPQSDPCATSLWSRTVRKLTAGQQITLNPSSCFHCGLLAHTLHWQAHKQLMAPFLLIVIKVESSELPQNLRWLKYAFLSLFQRKWWRTRTTTGQQQHIMDFDWNKESTADKDPFDLEIKWLICTSLKILETISFNQLRFPAQTNGPASFPSLIFLNNQRVFLLSWSDPSDVYLHPLPRPRPHPPSGCTESPDPINLPGVTGGRPQDTEGHQAGLYKGEENKFGLIDWQV